MELPIPSPLAKAREDAVLVLSRVLLWAVAPVALVGVLFRVIDGALRGEVVRSAMMLPPLVAVVLIGMFIGATSRFSLKTRGWVAIAGMSVVVGWGFLFNGPRLPNGAGAVALVSLGILLFDRLRQFLLLAGGLMLLIAVGMILRSYGIIEPAIDPMIYPLYFSVASTVMMTACLGFSGYLLYTTLQNYQAGQRELAERAMELVEAKERAQRLQQRERFAALASSMATELAEVVAVLGASSDEFRTHLRDGRGRLLLQDIQSVGTRVSQVLRLLASMDPSAPMVPLRIADMMQRIREQLPPMLPSNVTMDIQDSSSASQTVCCDRIEKVMWYLVLQARDAMPEGGTLTIRAYDGLGDMTRGAEGRNWLIIDVADTGAPGARRTLPSTIAPDPGPDTTSGAMAFGVAVVEQVVASCGGRIDVEQDPGQPVHFVLQLPTTAR